MPISQALSVVPAGQVAMADQPDAQLFMALGHGAARRMSEFKAQGLANTAWAVAIATTGQPDAQLFMALARMAERRVEEFKAQDFANAAWAFATAGQPDAQLFMALAILV